MKHLKQHQKWAPTKTCFYNKYHNRVVLGVRGYDRVSIDLKKFPKNTFRLNDRYDSTSVYTNNYDLLDYLVDNYRVMEINTPINEQHVHKLNTRGYKFEVREKLLHGKYKFKLEVWCTWYFRRFNQEHMVKLSEEVTNWIYDFNSNNKDDSRLYHPYYGGWGSPAIPILYLNDESALMLFKLQFDDEMLKTDIIEIATLEELEQYR